MSSTSNNSKRPDVHPERSFDNHSQGSKDPDTSPPHNNGDSRPTPGLPLPKGLYLKSLRERTTFYDLRGNHAAQRVHCRNAQQNWMALAEQVWKRLKPDVGDVDALEQLKASWQDIEQLD